MIVLLFSLYPAILSSSAILFAHASVVSSLLVLAASVLYLFHIRVLDEHRDFHHDNDHHSARPIQIGAISKEELKKIDIYVVILLLGITALLGINSFLLSLLMLVYSYFAGQEFFQGEKIRKHFFFYNLVNMFQMILLQIFVYLSFSDKLAFTQVLLFHFVFTTIGTVVFEFMRKLKIPGDDGTGKDTYTWYLGFGRSVFIYLFIALLDIIVFMKIQKLLFDDNRSFIFLAITSAILVSSVSAIHLFQKKQVTEQLLQLTFLVIYLVLNISIYITGMHTI